MFKFWCIENDLGLGHERIVASSSDGRKHSIPILSIGRYAESSNNGFTTFYAKCGKHLGTLKIPFDEVSTAIHNQRKRIDDL